MNEPLVSIVMNCYNSDRYLREAIESVYAQSYRNWEIIFFDNASTDNSKEIASNYDERLRYFRNFETVPLGEARNMAISYCRGDFIAFLDCDDIWFPKKLEKQIPLFRDSKIGLVFSNNYLNTIDGASRKNYQTSNDYAIGYCFSFLLNRYFLAIPTVIIRRSALTELNEIFDPRFSVCEEVDLFLRISKNWKLDMCDELLAIYRVHNESETWKKSEKFLIETLQILEKYKLSYSDFDNQYFQESNNMKDRAYWAHAVFCWRAGKIKESYTALKNIKTHNLKTCMFFVVITLPYRFFRPVMVLLGKALPL